MPTATSSSTTWAASSPRACQDLPYLYENETLRLDVSIGIAVTDARHLEKVDMALSVARTRKTFVTYQPELEVIKRYADNLHWLHVHREAVEQDRIIPYLSAHPEQRERDDRQVRIPHEDPDGGREDHPARAPFSRSPRRARCTPMLSRAIIQKTAAMMRGAERNVSINVSLEDIIHPDVLEVIERVVSENGLGQRIVLELLESEGIENYGEVSQFIERMKSPWMQDRHRRFRHRATRTSSTSSASAWTT